MDNTTNQHQHQQHQQHQHNITMNIDCTASTASSIARRAAVVNNEGTMLLHSGRCHDAVKAFSAVLGMLKPFIPGTTAATTTATVATTAAVATTGSYNVIDKSHYPAVVDVALNGPATVNGNVNTNMVTSMRSGERPPARDSDARIDNGNQDNSNDSNKSRRCCPDKRPVSATAGGSGDDDARAAKRKRAHNQSESLSVVEDHTTVLESKSTTSQTPAASGNSSSSYAHFYEEQHFVFQDPIEIPLEVVPRRSAPSKKLITKFVVVVMYNLALAVHLSADSPSPSPSSSCDDDVSMSSTIESIDGEKEEERRRAILARAQRLYELAFQMHLEESCDVTLLYSLALMNNLGLIYRMVGDVDRSQRCFQNQLSTMMYLLEAQEAPTIKQWDGLFSNVMHFVLRDGREISAPAA
jgi:hypothetical protein